MFAFYGYTEYVNKQRTMSLILIKFIGQNVKVVLSPIPKQKKKTFNFTRRKMHGQI